MGARGVLADQLDRSIRLKETEGREVSRGENHLQPSSNEKKLFSVLRNPI